jgi:uncharacterized protein (TIGR02246 family)
MFRACLLYCLLVAALLATPLVFAQASESQELKAFNQQFTKAILQMDNAAVLELWADDGVSLLPNMAPISGKQAIRKFMDDVTSRTKGYKVLSQENDWHGVEISGDLASEWAATKQVLQPPANKPVITIYGKLLLVLHREKNGSWKIKRESWTSSPAE